MANHRTLDTDGLSAIPKAAVESMVRQAASEEAAHGIRANAVAIGWIGGFADSFAQARAYTAAMSGPEAPATQALMARRWLDPNGAPRPWRRRPPTSWPPLRQAT
jgi:NAD(P)-dependent dehydrogenase (short-subunit alcohol dehydrogenase family)